MMLRRRHALLGLGWLFFAAGSVGIVVPLLPTTIFWILAAGCWVRSSPQLAERLYAHPRFGQAVRAFLERGEVSRTGKLAAAGGMAAGFTAWWLLSRPSGALALGVAAVLAAVAVWLATRREPGAGTQVRVGS